jgi:hypothetical protein
MYQHAITNQTVLPDRLYYPVLLDPVRTGRGFRLWNEKTLPFCQNRDFYNAQADFLLTEDYLNRYREYKTQIEVDTATHDMLDKAIINHWSRFMGDYACPIPGGIATLEKSNK